MFEFATWSPRQGGGGVNVSNCHRSNGKCFICKVEQESVLIFAVANGSEIRLGSMMNLECSLSKISLDIK